MGSLYRPRYRDKKTGEVHESAIWWAKFYTHGRMVRQSTETADHAEAKEFIKQKEGEAAAGKPVPTSARRILFSELLEDELNDYRVNGKRSLDDLEIRLEKHVTPFFGHRKATQIRTAEVRAYVVHRQAEGAKNGTINRELTAIKRAFSLGIQAGRIHAKPHIEMLREGKARTGFFEREQLAAVLPLLRSHNRGPARFAYVTGWRKEEILSLQWRQVDFGAGEVRLDAGTTKNEEGRVFPFTAELRELLEAQRAKADALKKDKAIITPWVFFVEEKGRRKGRRIAGFKRNWKSACTAAGVPARIFHDFRRTAVRNLVRAGVPERVAMQMTGHKTRSVFERYNIVSPGDLSDAARKLDDASSVRHTSPAKPRVS
jgi:integrase